MAQSDKEKGSEPKVVETTGASAGKVLKDPLAGLDLDGGRTAGAQKTAGARKTEGEDPLKVEIVESSPESAPEPAPTPSDRIAEDPEGEEVDPAVAEPEKMLRNVTNVDIAPVPREQMDEGNVMDPMKRQPGVAPSSVPTQEGALSTTPLEGEAEGEKVDFVMVMPYWDGIQLHEKGTVLPFSPDDAPFGAKRVK